ncbi:MAG: YeeE/YedE family protein [Hyphomicrobiaceae bacterium]|nr:MAG: YeeE/YedE family protein [Hyphomicrobiaceae bacterium]
MQALRDWAIANAPLVRAVGGLIVGMAFGAITLGTNFCTMGALSDLHSFGDWRRFRAWMLAIAVSIAGTQGLDAAGVVDLSKSMYLAPRLDWLGNVIGGLLFGFGMTFAGGCASRNLARAGSGDLRSLLVLVVLGISAYIALFGLLGPVRDGLANLTSVTLASLQADSQGIGRIGAALTGASGVRLTQWAAGLIAILLAAFAFKDKAFRSSSVHALSGVGVGVCVAIGWAVTGLSFDEFAPEVRPISLTYVRPTGDTLDWIQRFTAGRMPNFGVATVFGALLGAFLYAAAAGKLRVTTFADKGDTLRNLFGAFLMGIGGVMALGCTIGQALTGVSTLALGSFITTGAIIAGGIIGLKTLERILLAE